MDRAGRSAETLGRAGFDDLARRRHLYPADGRSACRLSRPWFRRLISSCSTSLRTISIWAELSGSRDCCSKPPSPSVIVSHDRYFLENIATEIAELSRVYPDGVLRVHGCYSTFLEKKEEFLHAQSKRQEALENLVHTEIEWLRRGPKARTTKSKARIDKAHELMGELADLNSRTRTGTAQVDFSASDRKTKRLIELENVAYHIGDRTLFSNLNFILTAGMRAGLVGPNGSGKTTLLRLLRGELSPAKATSAAPNGSALSTSINAASLIPT